MPVTGVFAVLMLMLTVLCAQQWGGGHIYSLGQRECASRYLIFTALCSFRKSGPIRSAYPFFKWTQSDPLFSSMEPQM